MSPKNDTSNLTLLMQLNTIGLSVVLVAFEQAMWHYTNPNWRTKASSNSLAFIQGTGLEVVLNFYGLMYDADYLRNVFFSMVGDHASIH